ncbi:hypothetical protein BDB01DRAFT_806402 [Pilobolus umbonatus]|nr:hypothetical protein BDB01DRAFT_806402 [Pilobolus umbonatus]
MIPLSVIENEQTKKKRRWHIGVLLVSIFLLLSYMIHIRNNAPIKEKPDKYIEFEIPEDQDPYYIDLVKYPVEEAMIQYFPYALSSIKEASAYQLTNQEDSVNTWLISNNTIDHGLSDRYSCRNQELPFPILRKMVADYFNIEDSDPLFHTHLDLSTPFAFLPSMDPELRKGQNVCLRVVVPFMDQGKDDFFKLMYKPFPQYSANMTSPWWDTMMVSFLNTETQSSQPVTMEPWLGHHVLRDAVRTRTQVDSQLPEWVKLRSDIYYERERMHVYEADIRIIENGTYEIKALLEFVEGRYNFEYGPVTPYNPVQLPVYPATVSINKTRADKLLTEHLSLPLCKRADMPGRWLPWPTKTKHKQSEVVLNKEHKYWAPYTCRYRPISYEQFNRCLSQKYPRGLDMYGDSHTRRSLKKIISHGHWCQHWEDHLTRPPVNDEEKPVIDTHLVAKRYDRPEDYVHTVDEQTHSCYCEDYNEPEWNRAWFDSYMRHSDITLNNNITQIQKIGHTEWDISPITNDSVPISAYKWDGLTYLNNPGWDQAIEGNTQPVDVAIFSLGNWDAAFLELDPYLSDVNTLIRQIKDHYDLTKTKIIYRTAQYYCCRVDLSSRARQISGPKNDAFDFIVREKFVSELNAIVWDTRVISESRTWEEKIEIVNCPSNHVAADLVEIENQVMMNSLCNL